MKYYILLLFDMVVKWVKAILLRVLMFIISIGAPNGILVSNEVLADDFMTNNPQLIEKYGEDYSLEFIGGAETGDKDFRGYAGEASFDYLVNGEDTYCVALRKEKGKDWEVEGFLCVSCQYVCDEAQILFDLRTQNSIERDSDPNGILETGGDRTNIFATLSPTGLYINDIKLWNSAIENDKVSDDYYYKKEWDIKSTILVCDVESNCDEFTATVLPEYQNLLGKDLTVLHFRAVE